MIAGRIAFVVLLALTTGALVLAARSRDRLLGWLVAVSVVVGTLAARAAVRMVSANGCTGRSYFAPDEQAYQVDGLHMAEAARGGPVHEAVTVNGWTRVNAAVILVPGPSLVPMPACSARSLSAATLWATYLLATAIFRTSIREARVATLFVFPSPSLCILSFTNLKERMLGLPITGDARRQRRSDSPLVLAELGLDARCLVLPRRIAPLLRRAPRMARDRRIHLAQSGSVAQQAAQRSHSRASIGVVLVRGNWNVFRQERCRKPSFAMSPRANRHEGRTTARSVNSRTRRTAALSRSSRSRAQSDVRAVRPFQRPWRRRQDDGSATAPEWLANLAFPLALAVGVLAVTRRQDALLAIPCVFVAGMMLLLAITHGDDWTTFRFRAVYWPSNSPLPLQVSWTCDSASCGAAARPRTPAASPRPIHTLSRPVWTSR